VKAGGDTAGMIRKRGIVLQNVLKRRTCAIQAPKFAVASRHRFQNCAKHTRTAYRIIRDRETVFGEEDLHVLHRKDCSTDRRSVQPGARLEMPREFPGATRSRSRLENTRSNHATENLATLRRLALNLLKGETTKRRGIRSKQLNASWDHARLLGV
jgi:hypothetical protein